MEAVTGFRKGSAQAVRHAAAPIPERGTPAATSRVASGVSRITSFQKRHAMPQEPKESEQTHVRCYVPEPHDLGASLRLAPSHGPAG